LLGDPQAALDYAYLFKTRSTYHGRSIPILISSNAATLPTSSRVA
jgi:hypothetical protein